MLFLPHGYLGRMLHRRVLARWRKVAKTAKTAELGALTTQHQMAQQLQRPLRLLSETAETRLALPRAGSTAFPKPAGTDWSWRPKPWRVQIAEKGIAPATSRSMLSDELVIFHDCKSQQIALRQIRNGRDDDLAPFRVVLETMHFSGSYMSLVIEVPSASCEGLRKRHLIRLAATIECERPTTIQARLNIKNGPNTEQILLTLPNDHADTQVEFDLAYGQLNERRAERMWVDLLIDNPRMNSIAFRDLTLARYPRAEI